MKVTTQGRYQLKECSETARNRSVVGDFPGGCAAAPIEFNKVAYITEILVISNNYIWQRLIQVVLELKYYKFAC
jgi:hypothetical protein